MYPADNHHDWLHMTQLLQYFTHCSRNLLQYTTTRTSKQQSVAHESQLLLIYVIGGPAGQVAGDAANAIHCLFHLSLLPQRTIDYCWKNLFAKVFTVSFLFPLKSWAMFFSNQGHIDSCPLITENHRPSINVPLNTVHCSHHIWVGCYTPLHCPWVWNIQL